MKIERIPFEECPHRWHDIPDALPLCKGYTDIEHYVSKLCFVVLEDNTIVLASWDDWNKNWFADGIGVVYPIKWRYKDKQQLLTKEEAKNRIEKILYGNCATMSEKIEQLTELVLNNG